MPSRSDEECPSSRVVQTNGPAERPAGPLTYQVGWMLSRPCGRQAGRPRRFTESSVPDSRGPCHVPGVLHFRRSDCGADSPHTNKVHHWRGVRQGRAQQIRRLPCGALRDRAVGRSRESELSGTLGVSASACQSAPEPWRIKGAHHPLPHRRSEHLWTLCRNRRETLKGAH
jgi:hypothetical protein